MTFRKIILGVAIILLIIALVMIGISIANSKYNQKFPPIVAMCPDYWDISGNNCVNSKKIGELNCHGNMNFTNSPHWTGADGMCNKQKWAMNPGCNITWDGVTNNVNACK